MELPEYHPAPPVASWEAYLTKEADNDKETNNNKETSYNKDISNVKEIGNNKESYKEIDNEAAQIESDSEKVKEKTPRRTASGGAPSLETMLFTEFDRQEEFHYSVITKLEEQAKHDESILKELRQATIFAKQNYEMLQALKNDIEHIKKDIRLLKSRGWFQRLFHNES